MNRDLFAVIMAGGRGERFWPLSREAKPKQFLHLVSEHALIRESYLRIRELVPPENVLVVTSGRYLDLCRKNLPEIPEENLIGEPVGRNTAPCAALAAGIVRRRAGADAVILTMPSDHVIENMEAFQVQMRLAAKFLRSQAASSDLMTFGIVPRSPATGFGYIRAGKVSGEIGSIVFRSVISFHEKPSLAVAGEYLASGEYLWNSGIFLWSAGALQSEFHQYAPELEDFLNRIAAAAPADQRSIVEKEYSQLPSISIDCAVFEKSCRTLLSPAVFDWDDVGSFASLKRHLATDRSGNASRGNVLFTDDTEDSLAISDADHEIVVAGLHDVAVIQDGSVVLVTPLAYGEKARGVINLVRREKPELLK